jgi:CMP/dCMP kinase
MSAGYIVAIDGPAGAGKSTIASGVAARLGLAKVDTGAIYRAVTLVALERGVAGDLESAALLQNLDLRFEDARIFLGAREVTKEIRAPAVTAEVSRVSAYPAVRAGLLEFQRKLGRNHPRGAVLEGRDIGTVVFPDAEVKIFLTASAEERARRRSLETGVPAEQILEEIRIRDQKDSSRPVAPLRPAPDAITVDSTGKTIDQVCDEIAALVRQRIGEP